MDTRIVGQTERVEFDTEFGCGSTVEARDAFHGWVKGPTLIHHIGPLANCLDANQWLAAREALERTREVTEGSTRMHVRSGCAELV